MTYAGDNLKVLITKEEIDTATDLLGKEISKIYKGKPLLLVGILSGSFIFLADLCRAIDIPCEIAFMKASSYGSGKSSSGRVDITLDLSADIKNYHVIIVEDIIDTGNTLKAITAVLKERDPLSLKVVTLLDKPSRRETDFSADRSLFSIPDLFVVGCGLDFDGRYRNLPYIAILE